ncbi:MAG TPA: DUF5691 domain-containing protein [Lapillicoccus sp.]|nr:DUF5691 domain-containing protein [Lapillicoccus sp.]
MTRASIAWDELVSAATVGTGTRPLPETGFHPTTVMSGLAEDAATRLLDLAAMETAAVAVTVEPGPATPVASAPAEVRPVMSAVLAALLLQAVRQDRELAAELFDQVAASGLVLPAADVPVFLGLGQDVRFGTALTAVVGRRGRWLVELDPEWHGLLPLVPPGDHLAVLRVTDPGAARDLLASEWAAAGADDRVGLLMALEESLDLDDVPFLESALGDRRAAVSTRASLLLERLCANQPLDAQPDIGRRMIARARPLVRLVRSGLMRPPTLEVVAPGSLDDEARRDGITDNDGGTRRGPRAAWLDQILRRTPLSLWENEFRRSPNEIVALPVTGDFEHELHQAWRSAAVGQRNVAWARGFLRLPDARVDWALAGVLPRDERVAYVRHVLGSVTPGDGAVLPLLTAVEGTWPADLATSVIGYLERLTRTAPGRDTPLLLRLVARRLPVRERVLVETIEARMTTEDWAEQQARTVSFDHPWRHALTTLSATLTVRARVDDELRRSTP